MEQKGAQLDILQLCALFNKLIAHERWSPIATINFHFIGLVPRSLPPSDSIWHKQHLMDKLADSTWVGNVFVIHPNQPFGEEPHSENSHQSPQINIHKCATLCNIRQEKLVLVARLLPRNSKLLGIFHSITHKTSSLARFPPQIHLQLHF